MFIEKDSLPSNQIGPLIKLGEGELGGKARMLPFVHRICEANRLSDAFAPHRITIPETWVLATDCFADFIGRNALQSSAEMCDNRHVRQRFVAAELAPAVVRALEAFAARHDGPIAVRSSALSEDINHHTTAGLFATIFVPNRGPERVLQLAEAVKLVYASAFTVEVERYMRRHGIPREDERMGVILQPAAGTARGELFYPLVSGVAQSINYFPVGQMTPEDGVANIVMGMGRRVVRGEDGLRFCPRYPTVRPSMHRGVDIERTRQKTFDAIDLGAVSERLLGSETQTLATRAIEAAEADGALELLASVWDVESNIFYDSLFHEGPRVLTFNRLLRDGAVPLAPMLTRILDNVSEGFGLPIEIEFALDISQHEGQQTASLALLQARPLPVLDREAPVEIPADLSASQLVLSSSRALGHGALDAICHVVFVDPRSFTLASSRRIADEVAQLNEQARAGGWRYLLVGPGRWGSSNEAVGVPVRFRQIDQACLIAEVSTPELALEPSQGTHFFHNMVSRALFYLSIDTRDGEESLDVRWLRETPGCGGDGKLVKLIRVDPPGLAIRVDAPSRRAVVFRP